MRRALSVAGLGLAAFLLGFLWFLGAAAEEPAAPTRRTGLIAVLTGGADRIETGLDLLERGAAPRLLVSGAARGLTVAELARRHRRNPAALAGRVALGHAAATTVGNAAEVAAHVQAEGIRSVRVVTAGYHMPRALLELRRAMPGVELVPHPVHPAALRGTEALGRPRTWTLLLGEYVKYLAAAAGITALIPARETARG